MQMISNNSVDPEQKAADLDLHCLKGVLMECIRSILKKLLPQWEYLGGKSYLFYRSSQTLVHVFSTGGKVWFRTLKHQRLDKYN